VSGRRRPHGATRFIGALGAAGLTLALGCSIPFDTGPRDAGRATGPSNDRATDTGTGDSRAMLYLVKDDLMAGAIRDVTDRQPNTLAEALAAQPDAAARSVGLVSQIPPGLEVRSIRRTDDGLIIDLSDVFDDVIGTARQEAVAQFVFTLGDSDVVRTFQFRIDGRPVLISTPARGDVPEVGECDFVGLLPTDDELRTLTLTDLVERGMRTRRDVVLNRCPNSQSEG